MKRLLLVVAVLLLAAAIGVGGFLFQLNAQATAPGQGTEELDLEVPRGANARSVGLQLQKTGLIGDTTVFRFVVWKRGGLALKAGKFKLSRALSPMALAAALEKPPLAEDEPFVVVEGWRIRDVDEALAAAGRADPGAYIKAASSRVGYIAPFTLPD